MLCQNIGETNFPPQEILQSGSKAKDGERKRKKRLNDGNNNGQLRIAHATSAELRIVPLGSSSNLTVRQRGKAIYSVFFLGGSSSVLAVLATILMSAIMMGVFQNSKVPPRPSISQVEDFVVGVIIVPHGRGLN